MAMSNAEKQANYRKRKIKEGDDERLQAVISLHAKLYSLTASRTAPTKPTPRGLTLGVGRVITVTGIRVYCN